MISNQLTPKKLGRQTTAAQTYTWPPLWSAPLWKYMSNNNPLHRQNRALIIGSHPLYKNESITPASFLMTLPLLKINYFHIKFWGNRWHKEPDQVNWE